MSSLSLSLSLSLLIYVLTFGYLVIYVFRYKIYIEGWAWSVSEKYILACNSPTLYVTPHYYDFLIRGMVPQKHYWPIKDTNKCKSLKFAVEWGNNHTDKVKNVCLKLKYIFCITLVPKILIFSTLSLNVGRQCLDVENLKKIKLWSEITWFHYLRSFRKDL